mgnify:CR=1 FL=1
MNAILIIDMQKSVFTTPRYDSDGVVNRINKLSELTRKSDGIVIYIQHNGSEDDNMSEGSQGWEIIDELNINKSDFKITKSACDSFYKTDLESLLNENNVKHVTITGAVTEFCVDTTIRSCLSKEFNVTVISDGHTTGNREHLDANTIIEHHNWTWSNLIMPSVELKVITASEFISSI